RQPGAAGDQLALRLRAGHPAPGVHPRELPRLPPLLRRRAALGAPVKILAGLFGALVVLFLLAPLLVLVPMSLGSADIAEFAPRFVPVIITALAFYGLLATLGLVGTVSGLILAHVVLAGPYVIIIVSATLRGFDRSLEQASASLGASPLRTALHVTLPLMRPGIVSAALVAFVISFDEIVVAIFIAGTRTVTLPKRMSDSLV